MTVKKSRAEAEALALEREWLCPGHWVPGAAFAGGLAGPSALEETLRKSKLHLKQPFGRA